MKRTLILVILAAFFVILNGCGKKIPEQTKPEDTAAKDRLASQQNMPAGQGDSGKDGNTPGAVDNIPSGTPPPAKPEDKPQAASPDTPSQKTGKEEQKTSGQQNQSGAAKDQGQENDGDRVIKSDNQPSKEETAKVFKELDKELEELENVLQQLDDVGEDSLDF